MSEGKERCTACRREAPTARYAGLCEACADEHHPPIERRGARWSPLAIGALSLVCDPLLIPTVMAIQRGFSELREVRLRELLGIHREEHERVRTGAVWGIVFGSGRILTFVLVVLAAALTGPLLQLRDEGTGAVSAEAYDELDEVLERLGGGDVDDVAIAIRHLPAVLLDRDDVAASAHALEVATALDNDANRDAAVDSALRGIPAIGEALERYVIAAHDRVGPGLQRSILERLALEGRVSALADALGSHAYDGPPHAALVERAGVDAALLGLPPDHVYRSLGAERFARECEDRELASTEVQLHVEESVARSLRLVAETGTSPLEHSRRLRHAATVVPGLACVSSESARAELTRLMGHEEPRIAVAAIATTRRFSPNEEAGRRALSVALRDPVARAAWHRLRMEIPLRHRSADQVAEAEGAWALDDAGHVCTDAAVDARYPTRGIARVVHRWTCDDDIERLTLSRHLPPLLGGWAETCATESIFLEDDRTLLGDTIDETDRAWPERCDRPAPFGARRDP